MYEGSRAEALDNAVEFFLGQVDDILLDLIGLTSNDLPDQDWYGMVQDGVSPEEAAHRALEG